MVGASWKGCVVRRSGAVVAVIGAGVALAVFASPAGAAVTPVPVVPPVAPVWTSTELGALAGQSSLADAVNGVTATAGKGAGFSGAAGSAFAAVGVAAVGAQAIDGTSWVMHQGFGYGTGSFACDVASLFNANSPCATAGAPPNYVVNGDVNTTGEGWKSGSYTLSVPAYNCISWGCGIGSLPLIFTASGPAVGAAGTITVSFAPAAGTWYAFNGPYLVIDSPQGTCSASGFNSNLGGVSGMHTGSNVNSVTEPADATCVWHIAVSSSTVEIDWYPVGHTLRPPDIPSDPTRTFTTTWTCADGTTGTATSAGFTESDAKWPALPSATCPAASGPVKSATVTEQGAGTTTKTVGTVDASGAASAFAGQNPSCAAGTCTLDLVRVDPTTGSRLDCFASADACASWWTETQKGTATGTQYACSYGGADVALTECTVLAHAFDQGVYSDPRTGEPLNATAPAPAGGVTCPPPFSWSGLLSAWWAYKASACALQWAFVPSSTAAGADLAQVRDVFSTRIPFSVVAAVPPMVTSLTGGWSGGCTSLPDFAPANTHATLTMPCQPPDSAGWRTAYGLMTAFVVVTAGLAIWRLTYGAIGGHS